jgi:drug/metabolite transporter (DMT)-like permease
VTEPTEGLHASRAHLLPTELGAFVAPEPASAPTAPLRSRALGTAALVGAALMFGSTFLVVKRAVEHASPVPFLAVRFTIAALALWPLARRRPAAPAEWKHGAAAGVALCLGYWTQTIGLQRVSSSTSAFLTYLLVVVVPLLEVAVLRRRPRRSTLVAVVLAVVGLVLLTGGGKVGFGLGHAETLACAVCFAAQMIILARVAPRHDPLRLTLVQLVVVAAMSWPLAPFTGGLGGFDAGALGAAAFTGVFATAVAFALMVAGQRVVAPTRAALVLLVEPVSAGLLGWVTGDGLGLRALFGAFVILGAILLAELGSMRTPSGLDPER